MRYACQWLLATMELNYCQAYWDAVYERELWLHVLMENLHEK